MSSVIAGCIICVGALLFSMFNIGTVLPGSRLTALLLFGLHLELFGIASILLGLAWITNNKKR